MKAIKFIIVTMIQIYASMLGLDKDEAKPRQVHKCVRVHAVPGQIYYYTSTDNVDVRSTFVYRIDDKPGIPPFITTSD